jgi:energy-coupling factor transporter transmembrane protein EcfT
MKKFTTYLKIFALLFFDSAIFLLRNPLFLTLLTIIFILILLPTKSQAIRRLKILVPLGILVILIQLFFNGSVSINTRILLGVVTIMKIGLVSLSVLLFLSFTSMLELIEAFNFLPKSWVLLLTITFYFIPSIINESEKIRIVQKLRGLKIGDWNIFKSLAALIVPLLHRVFQRAEILGLTIVSRGYE